MESNPSIIIQKEPVVDWLTWEQRYERTKQKLDEKYMLYWAQQNPFGIGNIYDDM